MERGKARWPIDTVSDMGDEKSLKCQNYDECHRTLRLSQRKRAKKCFSRTIKKLEEAVGPSGEDWLQNATGRKLQARKSETERDVFISPMSQCSSQLTPDILKFHRGRTFESSPDVSTFERLLSSQSSGGSPHNDWLHPSLGPSPLDGDSGVAIKNLTAEDAMMRSLGITRDDSVASWTSSLATPSRFPVSPESAVKRDAFDKEHMPAGKQKRVPRALFSPGLVQSQDELCCSLNESDVENRTELDVEKRTESNEDICSKQVIIKSDNVRTKTEVLEIDSAPLFSQELLPEDSNLNDNILQSHNIMQSPRTNMNSVRSEDNGSLIETQPVLVKQEVIDETLSDFFDPPSKSVGRRRCAPSKGRKRKSLGGLSVAGDDNIGGLSVAGDDNIGGLSVAGDGNIGGLSVAGDDNIRGKAGNSSTCSSPPAESTRKTPKGGAHKTPVGSGKRVKSILSSEKRSFRSGTRKRVTFSRSDEIVKDANMENRDCTKKENEEVSCQLSEQNHACPKLSKGVSSHEQSAITLDDPDDLFSQVSPSSLSEMCSINNEDLCSVQNLSQSNTIPNDCDKSEMISGNVKKEPYECDNDEKCKTFTKEPEKEKVDALSNDKLEETQVISKSSGLRSKSRKFLYPTTNQITKSCPKVVYGLKEVELPLHYPHVSEKRDTGIKQENHPATTPGTTRSTETSTSKVHPATTPGTTRSTETNTSKVHPATTPGTTRSTETNMSKVHPAITPGTTRSTETSTSKVHPAITPGTTRSTETNMSKVHPAITPGTTRSTETNTSKVHPATGFQKFSLLESVDEYKEENLKSKSNPLKDIKCEIVQKSTNVKTQEIRPVTHLNRDKKLSSPSTCKPLCTPSHSGSSEIQSSTEKELETTDRFEGFSTAGGRKLTIKNEALLKAKSLLEVDTANLLEETVPNVQHKLNPEKITDTPKVDYSQSKSNFKLLGEGGMGTFSECDAGFQGFQTASGKKVDCSESSLKKAQRIISEEVDAKEFPETGCDNILDLLPSAAKTISETSSMISSSVRKRPHSKENVAPTAVHSGNVGDKNIKGKNIFLDIFEEFEGCSELHSDSFTGFKSANANNISSVKFTKKIVSPAEIKTGSTNGQGIEENSTDMGEEEIVKTLFSGIRQKGIDSKYRQVSRGHSIQHMKSSSTAAKFPPGSNIPKGFRPFKAPKIVAKPKSDDVAVPKTSAVTPMVNDTGPLETLEPVSRIPVSVESSTCTERRKVSTGDEKMDETCDAKVTEGETPMENSDMSNLFLNDMFDEEMEISQKSECTVNRNIIDIKPSKVSTDREYGMVVPTPSEEEMKESTESNVKEQNLQPSVGLIENKPNFSGFQTASGKTVNIDEKSLKKAKELWESQANLAEVTGCFDESDPEVTFKNKGVHLLSTSAVRDVESKCEELSRRTIESNEILPGAALMSENQESKIRKEFQGFQTASGKIVNVDERSLSVAKGLWEKSHEDGCLRSEHKGDTSETFQGCRAASGEPKSARGDPKLGEKSLDLSSSNKYDQPLRMDGLERDVKFCGFQTASGKQVKVSENALSEANKLWENSSANDAQSLISLSDGKPCKNKLSFKGFQTASGNIVKVDEESLTEAKKLWTSSDLENSESLPQSVLENLFQPDNFSQVSVKDVEPSENQASGETLRMISATIETPQSVPHATTSDGPKSTINSTDISHEMSRTSGKEIENEYTQPLCAVSASNKGIHGSNQTLDYETSDTNAAGDRKENVKPVTGMDKAKANGHVLASSTACPFMSASGKQISVSSSALESTKSLFSELDESAGLNLTKSETISPFQSASGKSVSVSRKSLDKARAIFAENPEMETSDCASSTVTEPRLQEESFLPFQSAGGKKVSVSQKALEMARDKLAENFSKEQDPKPKFLNNDMDSGVSPFQSASGKSVKVCKTSLDRARARLAESVAGDCDNLLTSCIKGAGVVPQVNTPKRKLQDIQTPKKQTDRVLGYAREYENLVLPDDFFDEMETPNKKMKIDPDVPKKRSGHIATDRKNHMTALSTVPEGYTKDRQNFYTQPLRCKSDRDPEYSIAYLTAEETEKHRAPATPAVPGTSFRTPYKSGSISTESSHTAPRGKKAVQPVFVPKTQQEASGVPKTQQENSGVPKTQQENSGVPKTQPEASSVPKTQQENSGRTKTVNTASRQISSSEQTASHRNAGEDKKEFIKALEGARRKQEDIIKSKSSCSVKPSAGRLFLLKSSGNRVKLREVLTVRQHYMSPCNLPPTSCTVRASNAAKHRFHLPNFYGCDVTQVYVGDGALLVSDDDGFTGAKEMYKAFLTIASVDPSLISEGWFGNHYRWIVWKLASYEVASPDKFGSRALTPENVMLQMKYRYDREIDRCQRSALRKMMERDDAPTKRLVLCVCGIQRLVPTSTVTPATKQQTNAEPEVTVELTDGWYSIPAKLDVPLLDLINRKRLQTGHKICITGAELVGSQDPCTPLEAPASLQLKICANSTRPVPWDTVLGFQSDPRPLCVPLMDLHGDGGSVGCIDVVLGRKYPLMYMEKLPQGGTVFRTAQAEEKFSEFHQKQQQDAMEAAYIKLERKFDKEDYEESCAVKRQWNKSEIEDLQSGQEVWEALRTAKRPDILEGYLNDSQMRSLMEYKQTLHQEKLQRLQDEFQKSWSDEQGNTMSRNVVPLLKLRFVGICRKDVDSKISMIISVWRPDQEVMDLVEGQRYRIFSLSASQSRARSSQHGVQLTANRQTKFLPVSVDENLLDLVFEPRETLCACDLKRRQPPFGELDIVCFMVSIEGAELNERNQEILYGMDKNGDIIGIKFWGGLKAFGLNTTLSVGTLFCGSNLQDKFPYRSSVLPVIEASLEFSVFTKSPQGPTHRKAHQVLTERIKTAGEKTLVKRGQQLVSELLERKRKMTLGHTPIKKTGCASSASQTVPDNMSPYPPNSGHQTKMARLMSYGSPSPLSPIPTKVTQAAKKNFKVPKPADV